MVVVVAKITAKQGQGDALAEHLVSMVRWVVENEAETLTYTCNRSTKNPDEFVFYERYADQGAFEAHISSENFAAFGKQISGCLAGAPEIETFEEVAAKL
jgi:quinol monooxygenase YgiN